MKKILIWAGDITHFLKPKLYNLHSISFNGRDSTKLIRYMYFEALDLIWITHYRAHSNDSAFNRIFSIHKTQIRDLSIFDKYSLFIHLVCTIGESDPNNC